MGAWVGCAIPGKPTPSACATAVAAAATPPLEGTRDCRFYGSPPWFQEGKCRAATAVAQRHGVVCGKFLEASFRCFVPHSRILGTKRVVGAFGNR